MYNDKQGIIIYQTTDGLTKIDVRMANNSLWLTQAQIAEAFGRERSVITKHINNIFAESELDEKNNVQKGFTMNDEFLKNMGGGMYWKELPFMGLTVFKGKRPIKSEVTVAKNYMTEKELFALRRMVKEWG